MGCRHSANSRCFYPACASITCTCLMCFFYEWKAHMLFAFTIPQKGHSEDLKIVSMLLYFHKISAEGHKSHSICYPLFYGGEQRSWLLDSPCLKLVYLNTLPMEGKRFIQWQKIVLAAGMSSNLKADYGLCIVTSPTEQTACTRILETSYLDGLQELTSAQFCFTWGVGGEGAQI